MQHSELGAEFTNLVLEIFRINGVLLAEGDRLTAGLGLTSARWQIMGAISEEALPVPYIARKMGLTRQGVQKMANILIKEGLIELLENPHHKSSKILSLTAEGRRRMEEIGVIQAGWANETAAECSLEELGSALETLRKLRQSMDRKS